MIIHFEMHFENLVIPLCMMMMTTKMETYMWKGSPFVINGVHNHVFMMFNKINLKPTLHDLFQNALSVA